MPVWKNKQFYKLNQLKLGFFWEWGEQGFEFRIDEFDKGRNNRSRFFLCLPLFVEGLVLRLEVKSHGTEARSLEVEVKVLVVLEVTLVCFLGCWDASLFCCSLLTVLALLLRAYSCGRTLRQCLSLSAFFGGFSGTTHLDWHRWLFFATRCRHLWQGLLLLSTNFLVYNFLLQRLLDLQFTLCAQFWFLFNHLAPWGSHNLGGLIDVGLARFLS